MDDAAPLTVLMVSGQWPPETFIDRLARGLLAAGVHVQLAVSRGQELLGSADAPFEIVDLPSWSVAPWRRAITLVSMFVTKLVKHPREVLKLGRVLRRAVRIPEPHSRIRRWYQLLPFVGLRPTVVHFQWNSAAIDYEELFHFLDGPTVVSCRGSQVLVAPQNPKRREVIVGGLRRTLNAASRIHCVSDDMQAKVLTYGGQAAKTMVIRPAVDTVLFSPAPGDAARHPGTPLRVVTIGSLVWVKDHESALVAVSELVNAGIAATFHICGDGADRQAVEFTAADLGIAHLVNLRGKLSSEECRDVLRAADVFLLSSVAEGISNAALEAMACGLPVVTTDCGGMNEAVRDGIEGFLVPLRDPDAMAAALKRLADDEPLRQRMGASARERVLAGFRLEHQVAAFGALYAAAIDEAR